MRKKFPATSFTGSPVLSDAGFDLLNRLLTYDPEKVQALWKKIFISWMIWYADSLTVFHCWLQRYTVDAALKHDWFREVPLPKSKEFMPTFPAQHAQDRYSNYTILRLV